MVYVERCYSLPRMDDILDTLDGAQSLDLAPKNWQIEVDAEILAKSLIGVA